MMNDKIMREAIEWFARMATRDWRDPGQTANQIRDVCADIPEGECDTVWLAHVACRSPGSVQIDEVKVSCNPPDWPAVAGRRLVVEEWDTELLSEDGDVCEGVLAVVRLPDDR